MGTACLSETWLSPFFKKKAVVPFSGPRLPTAASGIHWEHPQPLVRMRSILVAIVATIAVGLSCLPASAASRASRGLDVSVRGATITLAIYEPAGAPRGTILMGSGDVGWVGLATTMAADLSGQGFYVVGLNVREYLDAFTSGSGHLTPADVQGDFHAIADALRAHGLLHAPVIASGVSEGAALAVLAAADTRNHAWLDGVDHDGTARNCRAGVAVVGLHVVDYEAQRTGTVLPGARLHRGRVAASTGDDPVDAGRIRAGGGLPDAAGSRP